MDDGTIHVKHGLRRLTHSYQQRGGGGDPPLLSGWHASCQIFPSRTLLVWGVPPSGPRFMFIHSTLHPPPPHSYIKRDVEGEGGSRRRETCLVGVHDIDRSGWRGGVEWEWGSHGSSPFIRCCVEPTLSGVKPAPCCMEPTSCCVEPTPQEYGGKERPARRQCRIFADSFLHYKNPKSMKHSAYPPVHFPRYNILFARFIYFPKKQISQDS